MRDIAEITRFVLLGHPRSGSTWMTHALNEHDDVLMYGELLNPDLEARVNGLNFGLQFETYLKKLPEPYDPPGDAGVFLDQIYGVATRTSHKAVGFKLHYEHAWAGRSWSNAWRRILHDKGIIKLHLHRRDLMRSYVSLRLADKMNEWVATKEHPASERNSQRLTVNLDHFRFFVRRCRRIQSLLQRLRPEHHYYEWTFEDSLIRSPTELVNSVFDALGLSHQEIENFVIAQKDFDIRQVVVNFADVERCWREIGNPAKALEYEGN